jgi:lysophospholipase L1-like esterase
MRIGTAAVALALALSSGAGAQTVAAPPVGIVADPCVGRTDAGDWANLCRYRAENAALPPRAPGEPPRVVFMGDSITQFWKDKDPPFFRGTGYVDRGIAGQTTPQMLLRFEQDVIALRPQAVHIMAATNDVAGNTGPSTLEDVENNFRAMATLAKAHGIAVILASVPPATDFPWKQGLAPAPKIAALNAWLRDYARREGFIYADYTAVLADPAGAMRPGLSSDGVHPTEQGYAVMEPVTRRAIARALARR